MGNTDTEGLGASLFLTDAMTDETDRSDAQPFALPRWMHSGRSGARRGRATELRVVEAVAEGLTNPEIADRLVMSRSTVKTHLGHVFATTGIRNRADLSAETTRRAGLDSDERA